MTDVSQMGCGSDYTTLYTYSFLKKSLNWMVSRLVRKGTGTKPGDLDLIPDTHRVKGENQPPQNTK